MLETCGVTEFQAPLVRLCPAHPLSSFGAGDMTSSIAGQLVPLEEVLRHCHAAWGRAWPPEPVPPLPTAAAPPPTSETHVRHVRSIGGPQTFSDPLFSVPLPDGGCLVADYGNSELKVVAASGEVVRVLGGFGRGLGELVRPRGLALTDDGLYVTDDADRVQQLDLDGAAIRSFPQRGAAAARDGSPAALCRPHGLALGTNGLLYVADTGHQRVAVFHPDGSLAFAFGRLGAQPGCFDEPRGLAVAGGRVWVADMCNHRVQAFRLDGRHLRTLGQHGDGPGQFKYPVGVAVATGRVFVSEYTGCRLQVLAAADGRLLQLVHTPAGPGCYLGALGVVGRALSVTDSASRVHLFAIEPPLARAHDADDAVAAPQYAAPHVAPRAGPDAAAVQASGLAPTSAADAAAHEGARLVAERQARVELAARAADMQGVLSALTQDDIHWLLPGAYADAAAHPEHYQFPPARPG